jgi:UPF0755 protein
MNDIRPPRRPQPRTAPAPLRPQPRTAYSVPPRVQEIPSPQNTVPAVLPSISVPPQAEPSKKPRRKKRLLLNILAAVIALLVAAGAGGLLWYQSQLKPVDSSNTATQRFVVEENTGPAAIAAMLEQKQLIRSARVFNLYIRLNNTAGNLQAGTFSLSQSMSVSEIVDHLKSGKTDTMTITFYPGATLRDTTSTPESKKTDVTTILRRAGYSDSDIEAALNKQYTHPVFATKPASADLEGYVYGETYQFASSSTVEQILIRTFDEMYKVIKDNNLEAAFKKQGLTLYQGLTLASIVQREVPTAGDQAAVARVFLNRIDAGMNLGSDVTYQYIADKTGVPRDPGLQSPYNTRINVGLTPGPIAAPGKSALLAVANPASNDYLFFLSGDDDKTYFGATQQEHEQNIVNHCQQKCQIL